MTRQSNPARALIGALALATALAASAFATAPAQARDPLGLHFRLENGALVTRGFPCVESTDYQVRRQVARRGYTNVYLGGQIGNNSVQVRATKDGWVYLMTYNRCSNEIGDYRRLRAAR